MMCPYICNIEQVNQNRYEYSDEGHNTFHEHKLVELKHPTGCKGAECAAWQNGKCCYRGE